MALRFAVLLAFGASVFVTQAKHVRRPNHQAPVVSGDASFKFAAVHADPAPVPKFRSQATPCAADLLITIAALCEDAAKDVKAPSSVNGKAPTQLSAAADYAQGCLLQKGTAYFSATAGSKSTESYICKIPAAEIKAAVEKAEKEAKMIFSTESEPCSEDTVIASKTVCQAAASALGYLDNTDNAKTETDLTINVGTLGPEYEKGCLINGGDAFFSETHEGDEGVKKTDKYICKVHGEYIMTNNPCEEAGLHSINSQAVCKGVSEGNTFEFEGPAGPQWQQGCLFQADTRRTFYSDAPDTTEAGQKPASAYLCASTSVPRAPHTTDTDTTHNLNSEDNVMEKIIMPPQRDCHVVLVGSSAAKTKTATVDNDQHICPKIVNKDNWIGQKYDSVAAYERYNDKFTVTQTGVNLVITRSDTVAADPSGWTLDLKFACCWKGGPAYNTVIEQDHGAK